MQKERKEEKTKQQLNDKTRLVVHRTQNNVLVLRRRRRPTSSSSDVAVNLYVREWRMRKKVLSVFIYYFILINDNNNSPGRASRMRANVCCCSSSSSSSHVCAFMRCVPQIHNLCECNTWWCPCPMTVKDVQFSIVSSALLLCGYCCRCCASYNRRQFVWIFVTLERWSVIT